MTHQSRIACDMCGRDIASQVKRFQYTARRAIYPDGNQIRALHESISHFKAIGLYSMASRLEGLLLGMDDTL